MSASAARGPVVKKKHVRFARMEEEDDDNDDQEEDTLFDKRKDTRRGLKSVLKAGKQSSNPGFDGVGIIGGGGRAAVSGACGRWMVTLALCASFLGLGMCLSLLGPTLGDLAVNVHKNISNISYIFVGRATGYIGGSLLGGLLIDHMNPHLLLGFSMLVTAFGMLAVPFCKEVLLLTALMSCIGASMGILDTGGNVQILNTWGTQAGPHMQALHFSFAVGAFASPIIAKLLFGTDPGTNASAAPATSAPVTAQQVPPAPSLPNVLHFIHSRFSARESMWAYVVIGFFVMLVSLLFFALCACGAPPQDRARASSGKRPVSRRHGALIGLLFVFFFLYVGAEVAYGSFIFTFAKDHARMEPHQAAGLNSLFWATFAAGRGLAIFFAACVHPGTMILMSLAGSTLSSLLLTLFSEQPAALWAGTGAYGISMSTTFPSGISWVEQYTAVTGRSAAVFVLGAALGEMVIPAALGFLLGRNTQQHPLLMYLVLGTSAATSILFPVMYKLASSPDGPGRKPRGRGRLEGDDSEYRRALLGAEDEEEEEQHQQQQQQQEDEADQWNDADFEVIEMDDASLLNSPNKALSSPPDGAAGLSGNAAGQAASVLSAAPPAQAPGGAFLSDSLSLLGESPRRKLLLSLDREKKD